VELEENHVRSRVSLSADLGTGESRRRQGHEAFVQLLTYDRLDREIFGWGLVRLVSRVRVFTHDSRQTLAASSTC